MRPFKKSCQHLEKVLKLPTFKQKSEKIEEISLKVPEMAHRTPA